MTLVECWYGKETFVNHLELFGCIAKVYIPKNCIKKLDAKRHPFFMMGYYDESKTYRLFDAIKQQIIIRINITFHDKVPGVNLLKSSYNTLDNDPFGIIEDSSSTTFLSYLNHSIDCYS